MCNENHDSEDCTYYLQKAMGERSKFLFKNKLCYGWVSKCKGGKLKMYFLSKFNLF